MPAYNSSATIGESIKSVQAQTYQNWELLITDDCSSDSTREVALRYIKLDSRIKLFMHKKNKGPSVARNNSIENAAGRYISFLDADDVWYPNKLELQIRAINESNASICHSSYIRFNENGELSTVIVKEELTHKDMLKSNGIGNLTGIYDAIKLGKFYQKNIGHEDYEMWISILNHANSIGLNGSIGVLEPLAKYRVSTKSLSSNILKGFVWHYKILKSQLNQNFFKIMFYMMAYVIESIKKRVKKY